MNHSTSMSKKTNNESDFNDKKSFQLTVGVLFFLVSSLMVSDWAMGLLPHILQY
jgi:hypothetical protein